MTKLLLLSSIISLIVLPIRYSRAKSEQAGFRNALASVAIFNFIYWVLVLGIWLHGITGMNPANFLKSVHE